jgi:hypothetical protein
MAAPLTILRNLRDHGRYLDQFPYYEQSAHFEHLIAQAFAHLLHLPFYTSDNDDANVIHRVTWRGSIENISTAPRGPDAVAYAYEHCVLIETTLKKGTNQWAQEFASSVRHYEDFVNEGGLNREDTYLILVAPEFHRDTYRSIRQKDIEGFNFVLLEVSALAKILDTSILAFTIRHLDLRDLYHGLQERCKRSSTIEDFLKRLGDSTSGWQQEVLKLEKTVFLGVKSYEAMRKIGRKSVGVSEIFQKLQWHPTVKHYIRIMGGRLTSHEIEESLLSESLGYQAGRTYDGEPSYPTL